MKISMEHWWSESDRAKEMYSQKKVNVYLSSLMMKVPDHVYVLG
jgi:hypothetical protein